MKPGVEEETALRKEMEIQRVLGVLAQARGEGGADPQEMAGKLGMTPRKLRYYVRLARLTGTPIVVAEGRYKLPETDEEIVRWVRHLQAHQSAIWTSVKALKDAVPPGTWERLKAEGKMDERQMEMFGR